MSRQRSDPSEVRGGSLGPLFDEPAKPEPDRHNTTHLTGEALRKRRQDARDQQNVILGWFERYPDRLFAPHELVHLFPPAVPLTSIRRALTNLTTAGKLIKTETRIDGPYGDLVHCWRLKR
jgi:hypothetical protein